MDIYISSALNWWDIWKLRILVLASTIVQVLLFLYGAARRAPIKRWLRVCIWLAYLAGDSVAIYALATLFNRHGRASTVGSTLEVLWAPVLLIHLAGQEQITAYSIQDNELWGRHVVVLLSQVAIALYVFCESWSGERRLLVAAILMFIIGIYKFSTKPWALKMASIRNLVSSPASVARMRGLVGSCGSRFRRWVHWWARNPVIWTFSESVLPPGDDVGLLEWRQARAEQEEKEATEEELSLSLYLEKVKQQRQEAGEEASREGDGAGCYLPLFFAETEAFAADLLVPYSRRLKILHFMWTIACKKDDSASVVQWGLGEIYYRLYTRAKAASTRLGATFRVLTFSLAIAAIVLFARTPKPHSDNIVDVKVTYILFSCVAALELLSFANVFFLGFGLVIAPANYSLVNMVGQQSLISSVALRRSPPPLLSLAACTGFDDLLLRHWYSTQAAASERIHEAVLAHVTKGWAEYIRYDPARYRRFNDLRGLWAVEQRQQRQDSHQWDLLLHSVSRPFDESVLLWHVATEICFHYANPATGSPRKLAREISCYMIYLLSVRPEMLMLGSRYHLFSIALDDIEVMLRYSDLDAADIDDRSVGCAILNKARREPWAYRDGIGPLIPKACELADALIQLLRLQEKETWEMVQGVWVEMLCYAASRGRGYMHAARRGESWELLSRVWLLLCFMGMETLADRLQRAEESTEHA